MAGDGLRELGWDLERLSADLERVKHFWAGEGRHLISVQCPRHAYRQLYRRGIIDEAEMVTLAAEQLRAQAAMPGINLPTFSADFGTISLARYWGGKVIPPQDGAMVYIEPAVQSVEEALRRRPMPVEDPRGDLALGLRLYHELRARLQTEQLWLRTPDMQGPLNLAGQVVRQEELLMDLHSAPDTAAQLLRKMTEQFIAAQRYVRHGSGHRVCGNIWPNTFLPENRGIAFTEDLMPLLPADLYARFAVPYLKQIDAAFGGLHIHCCGQWGRHAPALGQAGLRLRALEYHYPLTKVEELAALPADTVLVPYLMAEQQDRYASDVAYYRDLLEHTERRYWFSFVDDRAEVRQFIEDVGAWG